MVTVTDKFLFPLLLIKASGGRIRGRTRFQKLTFLYQSQSKAPVASYKFYPWDYGPYSSELQEFLNELVRRKLIAEVPVEFESDGPKKVYEYHLTPQGVEQVNRGIGTLGSRLGELNTLCQTWGEANLDRLVRHVYAQHPEYTVRSKLDI